MNHSEEQMHLERVLSGRAKPTLGPEAKLGRLAEIYLETPALSDHAKKSLELVRAALGLIVKDDPLYPKLKHLEAMALRWISVPEDDIKKAHQEAAEFDREAWQLSLETAPAEAILFAKQWADWAWDHSRWDEAGEAYLNAHRALRRFSLRLVGDVLDRVDLQAGSSLATRGAYSLVKSDKAREAIVLLERAYDVQFGLHEQRRDLERLQKTHPEIGDQLSEAMAARSSYVKPGFDNYGLDPLGNLSGSVHETQASLDAIVFRIRKLPGFESFALPSSWADVEAAAETMPLVYLVPTDKGSVALIVKRVTEKKHDILILDFPITSKQIHDAAKAFLNAEFGPQRGAAAQPLHSLLEWLGAAFVGHIRQVLDKNGHGDNPIAILPFGNLAYLPIHASFIRLRNPDRHHYLYHPKDVCFGYSARSLAESFRRRRQSPKDFALIVDNPAPLPLEFKPLQLSHFEAALVARHFPNKSLSGSDATVEKVLEELATAGLVHFSCHGSVDKRINYSGILLLADWQTLSWQQLCHVQTFSARLVVLSACRSGSTAIGIEYVLSLASAFLAAGATGVIGTFWHADELATLLLLSRFYDLWTAGNLLPAEALGQAQAWLMMASAATLIDSLEPEVLRSGAGERLVAMGPEERPYVHPWYWAGFFFAGA